MSPQLLDLFAKNATFSNFIPLQNEYIVQLLQSFNNQFTHIVGSTCTGKTHLLHACVNLAHARGLTGVFIDIRTETRTLRNLANSFSFIALDNIDYLNNAQQVEIFDLFNNIKLNNKDNVLLTSSTIHLKHAIYFREDLKTRLLSGINLNLKTLNDADLQFALDLYTTQEGIKLDTTEQNYLITHCTRNIGVLIQVINKIAELALAERKSITVPFIKKILNDV